MKMSLDEASTYRTTLGDCKLKLFSDESLNQAYFQMTNDSSRDYRRRVLEYAAGKIVVGGGYLQVEFMKAVSEITELEYDMRFDTSIKSETNFLFWALAIIGLINELLRIIAFRYDKYSLKGATYYANLYISVLLANTGYRL